MNVRLNESDRQTVDMLLSGEAADGGLDASMLERANSVRRILRLLDALPASEPPVGLADAVLQKIATSQVAPSEGAKPSAGL